MYSTMQLFLLTYLGVSVAKSVVCEGIIES